MEAVKEALKYENVAEVGDVIRSYNFRGVDNCYIEGVVLRKGDVHPEMHGVMFFEFRCTKAVRKGQTKEKAVGELFYAPFETCFMEYDGRIQKVSGLAEHIAKVNAAGKKYQSGYIPLSEDIEYWKKLSVFTIDNLDRYLLNKMEA